MQTVAALYVRRGGPYWDLPGVDPWDETRDARLYAGPHPVVAHPPCSRWCRLAGLVEARWGHKRGDDGGCFESALASVRAWGGVLEHPAYSDAWAHFGLPRPDRRGGWQRGICGGWVCHVEQFWYGHPARKATWLYAFGVEPPPMRWGSIAPGQERATCSWGHYDKRSAARIGDFDTNGRDLDSWENRPRLSPSRASETPAEFRDALLAIARSTTARTRSPSPPPAPWRSPPRSPAASSTSASRSD